jgi:hypothetical protein
MCCVCCECLERLWPALEGRCEAEATYPCPNKPPEEIFTWLETGAPAWPEWPECAFVLVWLVWLVWFRFELPVLCLLYPKEPERDRVAPAEVGRVVPPVFF